MAGFFLSGKTRVMTAVKLMLYTRTGCHLCEDMEQALPELAAELGFTVETVVIDNNNELEQAYGTKVPVLTIGSEIVCEYFIDKIALSNVVALHQ